ncbi:hypothetical protein B0H14DRAFT_19328 [Mycena olivaceomarginata]|nr:hypothetical protein B0H14DRAFT_19328 [Mycena olivaceomarginata]
MGSTLYFIDIYIDCLLRVYTHQTPSSRGFHASRPLLSRTSKSLCALSAHCSSTSQTNLVDRPTSEQTELSKSEQLAGVPVFLAKIARFRPSRRRLRRYRYSRNSRQKLESDLEQRPPKPKAGACGRTKWFTKILRNSAKHCSSRPSARLAS